MQTSGSLSRGPTFRSLPLSQPAADVRTSPITCPARSLPLLLGHLASKHLLNVRMQLAFTSIPSVCPRPRYFCPVFTERFSFSALLPSNPLTISLPPLTCPSHCWSQRNKNQEQKQNQEMNKCRCRYKSRGERRLTQCRTIISRDTLASIVEFPSKQEYVVMYCTTTSRSPLPSEQLSDLFIESAVSCQQVQLWDDPVSFEMSCRRAYANF